jgi:hypothetical protein
MMVSLAKLHRQTVPTHDSLPDKNDPHEFAETLTHHAALPQIAVGKSEITSENEFFAMIQARCEIVWLT